MKKINKQESPQWFEDWKKNFKVANNREPHYKNDFSTDDMDGVNRRRKLRECLVDEQGEICCYCMRKITTVLSHVEHFLPKDSFRNKTIYLLHVMEKKQLEKMRIIADIGKRTGGEGICFLQRIWK